MASREEQALNLAKLLRDSKVKECIRWFEVGLELGLAEHELKFIKADNPNDIQACKREMLSLWLRNSGYTTSLERIHEAIDNVEYGVVVERRARASHIAAIEGEDRRALSAVKDLQGMLAQFEERNDTIAQYHSKFVDELTHEKNWLTTTKDWEREDEEWRQGKIAAKQEKLREAITAGDFKSSKFVEEFFQQKLISYKNKSEQEIECILRQELLQIEVDRSEQARDRFGKSNEHDERLTYLLNEIKHSEDVIRNRIKTYKEIKDGLRNLGVQQTKLDELNEQVKHVETSLKECTKAREECTRVQERGNANLRERKQQIQHLLKSFQDFESQMQRIESKLKRDITVKSSLLEKMVTGAINGANRGYEYLYIFGIIPGAIVGGVGGIINGLSEENQQLRRELEASLDDNRQILQMCGQTLAIANSERDKLQDILC